MRLRSQRGQSTVELAMLIPILLSIGLVGAGLAMLSTASSEVQAATNMAALAAASAPPDRGDLVRTYANQAWNGTMTTHQHPFLRADTTVSGTGCQTSYTPGDVITCTGAVTVQLNESPVAILWQFTGGAILHGDPVIRATAKIRTSPYRSTCPASNPSCPPVAG